MIITKVGDGTTDQCQGAGRESQALDWIVVADNRDFDVWKVKRCWPSLRVFEQPLVLITPQNDGTVLRAGGISNSLFLG